MTDAVLHTEMGDVLIPKIDEIGHIGECISGPNAINPDSSYAEEEATTVEPKKFFFHLVVNGIEKTFIHEDRKQLEMARKSIVS